MTSLSTGRMQEFHNGKAAVLVLGLLVIGCRTGQVGGVGVVSPGGEGGACFKSVANPKFLLVHWTAAEQSVLNDLMVKGLAVVAADCGRVRLLKDCHIEGLYQFFGTTPAVQEMTLPWQEQEVNLAFGDQPVRPARSPVNLRLFRVGRMITTRKSAEPSLLTGDCAGATHFIRTISIGGAAFLRDGSPGAEPLTGSDLAACASASPTAPLPPPRCREILRVELVALSERTPRVATTPANCLPGWVFAQGKCVPRVANPVFDCTGGETECAEQCQRGSAASCNRAGELFRQAGVGKRVEAENAARYFAAACGMGYAPGCFNLGGYAYTAGAEEGEDLSVPELWQRACLGGHAPGCSNLGVLFDRGERVPKDRTRALEYFVRACVGGDEQGCLDAGLVCSSRGEPGDDKRAFLMFTLACEGGSVDGCDQATKLIGQVEGS